DETTNPCPRAAHPPHPTRSSSAFAISPPTRIVAPSPADRTRTDCPFRAGRASPEPHRTTLPPAVNRSTEPAFGATSSGLMDAPTCHRASNPRAAPRLSIHARLPLLVSPLPTPPTSAPPPPP